MPDELTSREQGVSKPESSETSGKATARLGRPPSDKILERLTTAGLKIIQDEDVTGLTIERVCKVAKVSRATFYRRWKSINPVFMAMVARILSNASPPVIEGNNLRENFERSMINRAELLADKQVGALFRYAFSLAGNDDELRYLIQELDRERNARLVDLFERAREEGRIRPDIRLDYVAHQLFGPIWHRSLLLQLPADPGFIKAVLDAVIRDITIPD